MLPHPFLELGDTVVGFAYLDFFLDFPAPDFPRDAPVRVRSWVVA